MKTLLMSKMIESGRPEFKLILKYTDVMDIIEYGPDESGFMSQDNIDYVVEDCEELINRAVCCDVDIIDGVAALTIKLNYAKKTETNIEEEVVMNNKNTKVMVSMVNGEVIVKGMKGKEYNAILDESFTETINGYRNTIRELNVTLTAVTEERNGLKTRLDAAIKYFNDNKDKLPGKNLNVKMTPVEQGQQPVKIAGHHYCDDCGREITEKAADYCKKNSAVFSDGVFCFKCQKKHARRAN